MIKSYGTYSPVDPYSDYEESLFNEPIVQSTDTDYDYPYTGTTRDKEISESEILTLCLEHYFTNYFFNIIDDKLSYFLLQSELFLNMRMYKDALSAALCFERLGGSSVISKCVKLVCYYQLNYIKNFKQLKDELMTCNLDNISEPLRKNVVGTIQVSTLIPEFMNCLNNMKKSKST